jgi:hypothetical protein
MRLRHLAPVLSAVAGLALAGVLAGPAQAAPVTATAGTSASSGVVVNANVKVSAFVALGKITAVDASAGTVTVRPVLATDTAALNITVTAKTAIRVNLAKVTLAKLPVGARVLVAGNADGTVRTANSIDALTLSNVHVDGTVTAVTSKAITLNVNAGGTSAAVNVPVSADAKITLNGKSVKLSDLPVGAKISLDGTDGTAGLLALKVTATVGR